MFSTLIIFIFVLGILILVHEVGHFFAAKKFGMKVEEFGFWFPPRLFKIKWRGTTYSFNLIPLGGFVKIKGEDGKYREESDSFGAKADWQRALTLFAGVSMNIVLAIFLLSACYKIGLPTVVEEGNQNYALKDPKVQIMEVASGSPAEEDGFEIGDTILQVNTKTISEVEDVVQEIESSRGRKTNFLIQRGKEILSFTTVPRISYPSGEGPLGVGLVKTAIISYPLPQAVFRGIIDTFYSVKLIGSALYHLLADIIVSGKISRDVAGPVGIAVLTGKVARMGWIYLAQFTALLSINLAIINILPFPALDGGRLLFLGIEKLIRRPLNKRIEAWANTAGFVFLIGLMIMVTFRDVGQTGLIEKIKDFF